MADGEYITRSEHNEFAKRLDDENKRQNRRIDELEKLVKSFADIPITVRQIKENQEKQETLLRDLINKPVSQINTAKQTIINTICSTLTTGFVAGLIGLIIYGLAK